MLTVAPSRCPTDGGRSCPARDSPCANRPDNDEDDVMDLELTCKPAVAPFMIEQGWGRIINISGLGARSATSAIGSMRNVAVSAMTKNLADELGPKGINVTVVHPGLTRTEATPGVMAWIGETRGIS